MAGILCTCADAYSLLSGVVRSQQTADSRSFLGGLRAALPDSFWDPEPAGSVTLPCALYPGETPAMVGGEVCLHEMEDDTETYTQLYFNEDGTITAGSTDGPLPEVTTGLWQCGSEGFQMIFSRTFTVEPSTLEGKLEGGMTDPITYSVTRVYLGAVNQDTVESTGIQMLEGRMELFSTDADYSSAEMQSSEVSSAWKGEVRSTSAMSTAIGYFWIDGNVDAELKTEE